MNDIVVERILEEVAKHGISSKTNKEWSMAKVELSNGSQPFIFNPIEVGDKVTVVKNGEYENYIKVKPDPKHDEIMNALRLLFTKLEALQEKLNEMV